MNKLLYILELVKLLIVCLILISIWFIFLYFVWLGLLVLPFILFGLFIIGFSGWVEQFGFFSLAWQVLDNFSTDTPYNQI